MIFRENILRNSIFNINFSIFCTLVEFVSYFYRLCISLLQRLLLLNLNQKFENHLINIFSSLNLKERVKVDFIYLYQQ